MGIFKNPFFSIAGQVERIKNVGAVLNAAFNPFSKDKVVANTSNPTVKAALETFANHPYISAGIVAGGITAIAKPAVAVSAAKALIPTTTKGKIIAAVAAPVVLGAVAQQPLKAAKVVIEAPSALANVGGNIANLVANPSLSNAANLIKENPVIGGGAAAVGAILGAKTLLPALVTSRQIQAIQEQTEAIQESTKGLQTQNLPYTGGTGLVSEKTLPTDEGKAITSETTTISTGKKRKRRARLQEKPSVRQNVQVVVSNRATASGMRIRSERYLNERLLA